MKSAAGVFIQPLHDAASADLPQWARIAHAVRRAAASGAVAGGERLPSARQLAQDWRVSRAAVEDAFAELQMEGLIERRVGDGTYLSRASAAAAAPRREATPEAQRILQRSRMFDCPPAQPDAAGRPQFVPTLHPRRIDLDDFPLDVWRRLLLQAFDEPQSDLLEGAPCGGLPALREAIARHLAIHRGLVCSSEQVLVINGPGEGMQLVGKLLMTPGDAMWIEQPGHATLPPLMRSIGLQVHGVPLDAEGLDVRAGERIAPHARLCYLHPLTQFPLGIRTSSARGAELLAWAARTGAWIVEAQMNDEWVPPAEQAPTLAAQDRAGRTILMGTFEGVVFPSLRLGYLVLPPALAPAFIAAAQGYGEHAMAPVQWALAQFIDRGHMTTHLQAQRARCAEKRAHVRRVLLPALQALPRGVRVGPMSAGLHLCLHLPPEVADTEVVQRLRGRRLYVEALSTQAPPGAGLNGIALGYGGLDDATLERGLRGVAQALAEAFEAAYPPAAARAGARRAATVTRASMR